MKVCLIRHSITKGNLKKRYLGTTDEELCQEGIDLLEEKKDEFAKKDVSIVFSSPMKRCLQTAKTLFPKHEIIVIPELSECDFGIFEIKIMKSCLTVQSIKIGLTVMVRIRFQVEKVLKIFLSEAEEDLKKD